MGPASRSPSLPRVQKITMRLTIIACIAITVVAVVALPYEAEDAIVPEDELWVEKHHESELLADADSKEKAASKKEKGGCKPDILKNCDSYKKNCDSGKIQYHCATTCCADGCCKKSSKEKAAPEKEKGGCKPDNLKNCDSYKKKGQCDSGKIQYHCATTCCADGCCKKSYKKRSKLDCGNLFSDGGCIRSKGCKWDKEQRKCTGTQIITSVKGCKPDTSPKCTGKADQCKGAAAHIYNQYCASSCCVNGCCNNAKAKKDPSAEKKAAEKKAADKKKK